MTSVRAGTDRLREWLAFKIAPWLHVRYRDDYEEAFRDLAQIAYGSRAAVWTSPRVLVRVALEHADRMYARKVASPVSVTADQEAGQPTTESKHQSRRQWCSRCGKKYDGTSTHGPGHCAPEDESERT